MKVGDLVAPKKVPWMSGMSCGLIVRRSIGADWIVYWSHDFPWEEEYGEDLEVVNEVD